MNEYRQTLERLFEAALELLPDRRQAFVRSNCHDEQMLIELLELLEVSTDDEEGFLPELVENASADNPILVEGGTGIEASSETLVGQEDSTCESIGSNGRSFGHFEIIEEIARGGMGIVYKARDTRLNRIVALKMIRAGNLASEQDVKRFYTEAEAAAHLDHPNIVPVFEASENDGHHYFSMGFVDGCGLNDLIRENPLPSRKAAEYLKTVASAIQYAHSQGVLHRDLKPSNVLVDKNDQPRVTDFGLAKRVQDDSELTATDQVMGTPSFMPPEQAMGKHQQIDVTTDVYSLGATLYCLITGRPPFQGQTVAATLMQVINNEAAAPRLLNAQIDDDLETICLKCLEKDGFWRYQSAEELAQELGRYLNGEPINARPVSKRQQAWRWCKRNPVVAGLSGTIVLVLLLGVIFATSFAIAARRNSNLANRERDRADAQARIARRNEAEALKQKALADQNASNAVRQKTLAEQKTREALAERKRANAEAEYATRQERLASVRLYATEIAASQHEWETGNMLFAWRHWETCRDDLRGWEHRYLYALFKRTQQTLIGHTKEVRSVAFSPDGRRIASGSDDNTVKIWDANLGKEVHTLMGHSGHVSSVAFSPDGRRIVSGSWDHTLKVWDAVTGQEILTLRGHTNRVYSVAFSPDSHAIMSLSLDKTLIVWEAETGRPIRNLTLNGHGVVVFDVAFSPDGRRIVSGSSDHSLKIWDSKTGEETLTLAGHTGNVGSVAFSPDGKWIVSGSQDGTLKIWDAGTGQQELTLRGHVGAVFDVAFSQDNRRVVSGGRDKTVKVWDVETGQVTRTFAGHTSLVYSVDFSSDGRHVVSGSADNTLTVWDLEAGQETLILSGHADGVTSVAFSPDGGRIVSGSVSGTGDTLKVWNAETGQLTHTTPRVGGVNCVAFSPDGRRIVTGGHCGFVWDAGTGQPTVAFGGDEYEVSSVAFSPDGHLIASTCRDNTTVWDAESGEEALTLRSHPNHVHGVAFSPDGRRIASGSDDNTVKIWDANLGKEVHTLMGHSGHVSSVAFSPDGRRIVSGSWDHTLKVWDAVTGKENFALRGHADSVLCVAFSPDGRRIVSGSRDKTLKIWDTMTGQETLTLKAHASDVNSVAFSPDGRRIVSGSWDTTVKVWDAAMAGGE